MERLFKHVKTGHYYWVISFSGVIESTLEEAVIYCRVNNVDDLDNGKGRTYWIRSKKEFFDGRFKKIILKE